MECLIGQLMMEEIESIKKWNCEIDKACDKNDKILTVKSNVEMTKYWMRQIIDKENISAFLFQRSKAATIVVYPCDIEINK